MSYELVVFEPAAVPRERAQFLLWYEKQSEFSEPRDYNNPTGLSAMVKPWFMEIITQFPPLNGPYSPKEWPADDSYVTDYGLGGRFIIAGFGWAKAERAFQMAFRLAAKHGLGFFEAGAASGGVWLPGEDGQLALVHENKQGRRVAEAQ